MQYKMKLVYAGLAAVVAWFAIGLQFYVPMPGNLAAGHTVIASIMQVLSYFTVLTNLIVALAYSYLLLGRTSKTGKFFSQTATLTSIAVYITIVGFIYELLLRSRWDPQGWAKLADILLHTVNPILFIIFWFVFVPKELLKWRLAINWLLYPLIYLIFTLIRGEILDVYPYHFINVTALGYWQVTINCLWVLLAFLSFSGIFLSISRLLSPSATKK